MLNVLASQEDKTQRQIISLLELVFTLLITHKLKKKKMFTTAMYALVRAAILQY